MQSTSALPKHQLTPEDYLALEEAAVTKSEYFNGEMFAMSGGSYRHARLSGSITGELHGHLRGKECHVLSSYMMVLVAATGLFTYPDVSVLCGKPEFAPISKAAIINPNVILEVLSPSTEKYDRQKKFWHYQKIPSLREYVLVAQDTACVEHYHRETPNQSEQWIYTNCGGLDAILRLPSLNIELPLRDIYAGVTFDDPDSADAENAAKPGPPSL